ncbi:hypothetical protein ABNP34_12700 [Glutamicibacter mishrai]|uniref:hypothetical protein n=1 Tax=Glutamicibacter mishrai TaxID=1775880 RepID=UPI0032ECC96C
MIIPNSTVRKMNEYRNYLPLPLEAFKYVDEMWTYRDDYDFGPYFDQAAEEISKHFGVLISPNHIYRDQDDDYLWFTSTDDMSESELKEHRSPVNWNVFYTWDPMQLGFRNGILLGGPRHAETLVINPSDSFPAEVEKHRVLSEGDLDELDLDVDTDEDGNILPEFWGAYINIGWDTLNNIWHCQWLEMDPKEYYSYR